MVLHEQEGTFNFSAERLKSRGARGEPQTGCNTGRCLSEGGTATGHIPQERMLKVIVRQRNNKQLEMFVLPQCKCLCTSTYSSLFLATFFFS